MTQNTEHSDIAYLRDLAEAGQSAPFVGGRMMVWWGGLSSLTMVIHWAIYAQYIPLGQSALLPLWLSYIVIGSIGSALLSRGLKAKPGAGSMNNRLTSTLWPSAGLAIMGYFIGVLIGTWTGLLNPIMFNTILPAALLAYTIAWMTTALIAKQKALFIPAAIAFIGVPVSVAFVATPHVYLITALVIFLSTLIPGVLQMRAEPQAVV